MNKIKWSNIPVPESHVISLIAGIALHVWRPLVLWDATWQRYALGGILLLAGIALALWATAVFEQMSFQEPTKLITKGPYAISRNPMYGAWTLIYLGTTLLVNTWWLFILLPLPLLATHYISVLLEERNLERKFGDEYRQYRARVRRYL